MSDFGWHWVYLLMNKNKNKNKSPTTKDCFGAVIAAMETAYHFALPALPLFFFFFPLVKKLLPQNPFLCPGTFYSLK